ncbi:MAG: 1-deoxy-D-xylulose-5-phosphate reductoisomerase [Sedimentisphaerales bacterium]|nr:1-deoxy-D-xylulose-5-phosphate reductoisomerase [Sedimentisphaerales bacterium]
MTKKIAILGSTGSIGQSALNVIEALGPEYEVFALSAHSKVEILAEQVRRFRPAVAALTNSTGPDGVDYLKTRFSGTILTGAGALVDIAGMPQVDIVLFGVVGAAGLPAVMAAAQAGKVLAIANKEPLVIAGQILMKTARRHGATILPVDSEHSAIFQSLQAGKASEVNKIILTASGGPFRKATAETFANATKEQALAHPTWAMGPKITVDSATMMNKALEVIEAVRLFETPPEKVDVLVHPESIVHSMVEYVDGSVIAQLGTPDMKTPIQYALTYPKRVPGIAKGLDLAHLGRLTFELPNRSIFRSLDLGFEAARVGGSAPAVFNAANEAAVEQFLSGRIRLGTILELVEHCLQVHAVRQGLGLEELMDVDRWARAEVEQVLKNRRQLMV